MLLAVVAVVVAFSYELFKATLKKKIKKLKNFLKMANGFRSVVLSLNNEKGRKNVALESLVLGATHL